MKLNCKKGAHSVLKSDSQLTHTCGNFSARGGGYTSLARRVVCAGLAGSLCVLGVSAVVPQVGEVGPGIAFAAQAEQRAVNFHYVTAADDDDSLVWQTHAGSVSVGNRPSWNSSALSAFVAGGARYTFIGWTTSEATAQASVEGTAPSADDYYPAKSGTAVDLPAAEEGEGALEYWAVYRKTVLRFEVTFYMDSGRTTSYTAQNVAYGALLSDVWAQSVDAFVDGEATWKGGNAPVGDPVYSGTEEDMEFAGWVNSRDWSSTGTNTPANPSLTASGQSFYPTFSKIPTETVSFVVSDDETTVVHALAGLSLADVYTKTPVAYGKRFAGWLDKDGNRVTQVPRASSTRLYVRWEDLSAVGDDDSASTVDVSKVYLDETGVEDADWAGASIAYMSGSSELKPLVEADEYEYLAAFQLQVGWNAGSSSHAVETGFGDVTAKLSWENLANGDMVRVYWLRADGTTGYVDKTVADGAAECSFATLRMNGAANIVLARVPVSKQTDTTKSDADKAASKKASAAAVKAATSKAKKKSGKSSKKNGSSKKSGSNAKSSGSESSGLGGSSSSGATTAGTLGGSLTNSSSGGTLGSSLTNTASATASGTGASLANTASATAASGSTSGNTSGGSGTEAAQADSQQAGAGLADQAQAATSEDFAPAAAEEGSAFPWPWAALAAAIAAIAAALVVFSRRHRKGVEAAAEAPLTEEETDDIGSANF